MKARRFLLFVLAAVAVSSSPLAAQPAPKTKGARAVPAQPAPAEVLAIEGLAIARPDGRFLGLTLAEGKFKLRFYGKDRKPVPPDALRAVARWPNVHGPGQHRTVLTPAGDGSFLLGAQFVRPPHTFKLFLTLIAAEGVEPTESYSVDFRG